MIRVDESVEMLKRDYPVVNVIANTENVGFGKACNQIHSAGTRQIRFTFKPPTPSSPIQQSARWRPTWTRTLNAAQPDRKSSTRWHVCN
jgi:hypothetical protein